MICTLHVREEISTGRSGLLSRWPHDAWPLGGNRFERIGRHRCFPKSALNRRRARLRRDLTVPIGIPSASAIS